jgi:phosphoribosyl-AMP cyclohydrolase / phosphoribosyl-ATP pyrophosphohydrolase
MTSFPIDTLRFDENGLIPAIVQDVNHQTVLMLGFMNRDSLLRTVTEGKVCFWSRSRQKFWLKGETSGMFLLVRSVRVNCENNSLLILAEPIGPTCHTGHESCYFREAQESDEGGEWVEIAPVLTDPEALYGKK